VYFGLRPFAPFLIYFTYQKKLKGDFQIWKLLAVIRMFSSSSGQINAKDAYQ
jgi:hypothetical protein